MSEIFSQRAKESPNITRRRALKLGLIAPTVLLAACSGGNSVGTQVVDIHQPDRIEYVMIPYLRESINTLFDVKALNTGVSTAPRVIGQWAWENGYAEGIEIATGNSLIPVLRMAATYPESVVHKPLAKVLTPLPTPGTDTLPGFISFNAQVNLAALAGDMKPEGNRLSAIQMAKMLTGGLFKVPSEAKVVPFVSPVERSVLVAPFSYKDPVIPSEALVRGGIGAVLGTAAGFFLRDRFSSGSSQTVYQQESTTLDQFDLDFGFDSEAEPVYPIRRSSTSRSTAMPLILGGIVGSILGEASLLEGPLSKKNTGQRSSTITPSGEMTYSLQFATPIATAARPRNIPTK
jgi:hypothetical protein